MERATKTQSLLNIKRLGFYPKTIIDVGAQVGTAPLYKVFPDAHHLMIEPIIENEIPLKNICKNLPSAEYIIAAATSVNQTISLKVSPSAKYAYKVPNSTSSSNGFSIRKINGYSLDSLYVQKNLEPPFLLKIDVDGSEIDVLQGSIELLKETEYVIAEATTNNGQRIFDIINFMRDQGFHVYDIVDFMYRPEINDLWQVDVAFVKAHDSAIPYKTDRRFAPMAKLQPNQK